MKSISIVKVLCYFVRFTKREFALMAKIEYGILILIIKIYYLPLIIWMYNRQRSALIRLVGDVELIGIE